MILAISRRFIIIALLFVKRERHPGPGAERRLSRGGHLPESLRFGAGWKKKNRNGSSETQGKEQISNCFPNFVSESEVFETGAEPTKGSGTNLL